MYVVRGKSSLQVLLDNDLDQLKDYIYYNFERQSNQEPLASNFITLYLVFDTVSVLYTPTKLAGARNITMFHLLDCFTLKKSSFVPIFDLKQVYASYDKEQYVKRLREYGFTISLEQFIDYITELYKERILGETSNVFAEYTTKRENDIKIYNSDRSNKTLIKKLYNPLLETELELGDHLDKVLYSYIQMVQYSGLKGRRIKLSELFDKFALSEGVPFIGINGSIAQTNGDHKFRAIKGFDVPQSWMINEKKQTGEYTYKNIKGVMLKIKYSTNYLSVNIEANGDVYITLDLEKRNISGGVISRQSMEYIDTIPYDTITETINGVLTEINKLPIFAERIIENLVMEKIKLVDITVRYITKQRINKSALVKTFSALPNNSIFEYRETKGKDTTVSLYYKRASSPLIINIEDNIHQEGSSMISVFKCENLYQSSVILVYLLKLSKSRDWLDTDKSKQKLSPETELKQLKKENVKIDSRNCQKPRQPQIHSEKRPLKGSYALDYEEKRYVCLKPEYSFPGFTSKNVVCCFKKDQRNNKYYIQNTMKSDINVFVSPSNYFLEEYQTFLLKKDNKYSIINSDGDLEEIPSAPEYKDVNFFPMVTLAQLKALPKKTNCEKLPNMSKPESERCNHHKIHKVYGYSSSSFPCCFESLEQTGSRGRASEHVFIKDTILPDKREGKMFGIIDVFFNKVVSDSEFETFQRYGVLQDNYSLLRALMYSKNELVSIDSLLDQLVSFVTPEVFSKLSGGKISIMFEYSDYVKKLRAFELQTMYILDLVSIFFGVNVLILDSDRQQIVCTPSVTVTKNPFVILMRHSPEHYELVMLKHLNKTVMRYTQDDRVVQMLQEYQQSTCKRISEYPQDYIYDKLTDFNTVKDKFTLKYQVVNKYNKVYLLITSIGPLPIKQISPLPGVPKVDIYKLRNSFDYVTISRAIENVNKFLENKIDIRSQVVSQNKTIGVLTSVGLVIPIKETSIIKDLSVSELRWYYGDEDNYIYDRVEDTSRRIQFWNEHQQLRDLVNEAKKKIQNYLHEYIQEYTRVLKDTKLSLRSKYSSIFSLVKKLLPDESYFVVSIIARDITLDPEYLTLFHKSTRVADHSFVLESILDIRNYLTKKKSVLPMVL